MARAIGGGPIARPTIEIAAGNPANFRMSAELFASDGEHDETGQIPNPDAAARHEQRADDAAPASLGDCGRRRTRAHELDGSLRAGPCDAPARLSQANPRGTNR